MNYIDPLYDWEGFYESRSRVISEADLEAVYPRPEVPQPAKPVAVSPEECERLWNLVIQASKN